MDPVTGLGLVASVVQLLTFGINTVSTIREVYHRGSISSYDDVEYITGHLGKLTRSLQQSLENSHTHSSALSRDEKDLIDLGRKCEDCAQKLQHELRKLSSQPRISLLAATRKTARAIWKRPKIEEISNQLATYKSTLETSLLHRLSQLFAAQSLRNEKSFASLDEVLQQFVIDLADSHTSLATLTAQESDQTRSHITTQIHQVEQHRLDHRLYDEVTRSLFYPDIFSRQEQVGHIFDGIENSYDWIFQEPRTREVGENNQDFNGTSRRLDYLNEWCPDRLLLTPSYFFWAAGSRQQKSIDGLLRTLIYQMLTECHELVGCLKIEPLHAWTESRLLATLLSVLKQSQIPVAVCMFLDGLDEIDGRYDTVVQMMEDLAHHTNIKICLSSRPLPVFEEAFSGAPGLKLQDFTFHSIQAYADVQLSDLIYRRVLHDKQEGHQARNIINTIVERADGVFLWAVIAIRDVRDGLQGIVDLNELAQTVDSLPPELESLFMLMLNRIKPAYQRDAARFLQIALHAQDRASYPGFHGELPLTLCSLHLIRSQRDFEHAPFNYEKVATSEIVKVCETLRIQLLSHTAGLLELTSRAQWTSNDDLLPNQPLLNMDVQFLHRTVKDFLCYNDEASLFLARKGFTKPQVHLAIARGRLAQVAQFSEECRADSGDTPAYRVFSAAMQHVSLAERFIGAAQSDVMRSLIYESYVRNYSIVYDTVTGNRMASTEAFMINDAGTSIDVVGMAAAASMTLYVCERLGISNASQGYAPDLPGLNHYCTNINTQAVLTWTQPSQSEESDESVEHDLRSSSYRQTLGRYLRLDSDVPMDSGPEMASDAEIDTDSETNSWTRSLWAKDTSAETYLLSCCSPSCHDLIRILLHAGANPMAVVVPVKSNIRTSEPKCFWQRWIRLLREFRLYHRETNGRSGRILLDDSHPNLPTPKTILGITKALLARGADVNFQLSTGASAGDYSYLKRRTPDFYYLAFEFHATAMFVLENYFNKEPEFRKFAIAIESFIKRRTRTLVRMRAQKCTVSRNYCDFASLSPKECETLWPLIEKWEETGHTTDLEALRSVMEKVWKSHRPNWDEEDGEEDTEEDNAASVRSLSSSP